MKTKCIIWDKHINNGGYGQWTKVVNGKRPPAHRYLYEEKFGKLPEDLVLDHLCRNRACVNLEHLEPVTVRENILRGVSKQAKNAIKTRCLKGHAFDEKNTYLYRTSRHCRTCKNDRQVKTRRLSLKLL